MLGAMKRLHLDPLILMILAAIAVATVLPISGEPAQWFSRLATFSVSVLFFLYGARLSPTEALQGLKHWRLHLIILFFTFVLFPLIGLALFYATGGVLPELALGILYLALVPSTVQSSVAFTSIAGGNVAGAIVSATVSNLVGVILTPLLVAVTMAQASGFHVHGDTFLNIALTLLLPFILGQLLRRWVGGFAARKGTKLFDRATIIMVVYSAFSEGMVTGIWQRTSAAHLTLLCVLIVLWVAAMLWVTDFAAARCHFNQADRIAIQFCGTKKSLATGLPMAVVIFAGTEVNTSLLILPLMLFHLLQLMMCAWLAGSYASRQNREVAPTER